MSEQGELNVNDKLNVKNFMKLQSSERSKRILNFHRQG